MKLFGLPIFGFILPFIGFRRIYTDACGEPMDTGEFDMMDERGAFYVEPLVFGWLGFGFPFPCRYRVRAA